MKKVLITGANSYIGTSFENWTIENCPEEISCTTIDMQDSIWRETSFVGFDCIFHVAGIAHADVGKVSAEEQKRYYRVNCDLAVECAKKAKAEGVGQFLYMSSIIVYGESAGVGKEKVITKDTPLAPANFYGDSKKKAEEGLLPLNDASFKVVLLRPPMIYGKGSKGNFPLLVRLADKLPIFPDVKNQRSMLYIKNLCSFVQLLIQHQDSGIFYPQNEEYVSTARMVALIAKVKSKKLRMTKALNFALLLAGKMPGKIGGLTNKAFGNLVYDQNLSYYKEPYCQYSLEESIQDIFGSRQTEE